MENKSYVFNSEIPYEVTGEGTKRKVLAYNDKMMAVENKFEKGAKGAPHQHPHLQIVYVPEGEFYFTVEGETKIIKKGDSVLVKENAIHSCECIEEGILLDIFSPMREDFIK